MTVRRYLSFLPVGIASLSIAVIGVSADPASAQRAGALQRGVAIEPAGSPIHVSKELLRQQAQAARSGTVREVPVIVRLREEALASYRGSIAGLPATSPRALGTNRLDVRSPSSQRYLAHLRGRQQTFVGQLRGAIPTARVMHQYQAALNGLALRVPENRISALAALPGVAGIYEDRLERLRTDSSPAFIGAPAAWQAVGGSGSAGEGVIVGVLDSGIWPEHPSLSDPDPLGKPVPAPPGAARPCEFSTGANPGAPFSCNNKLIGARRFMATYDAQIALLPTEYTSARDDDGHGTHTATTAVGNRQVPASIGGRSLGTVSGIAPRAHLMVYKVCGTLGCYGSDSAAAVNQAILDGVDVINFSISGGSQPYADAVSLAFLDAYEAGIVVAASAGNSGPTSDTVDHREPWTITVAASTSNRQFQGRVSLSAPGGASLVLTGATITPGVAAAPLLVPADRACTTPLAAGSATGRVVVCERGVNSRVAKSFNVLQGGAVGMVLLNTALQGLATDSHFLPTVHLEFDAATALKNFLAAHPNASAALSAGVAVAAAGDVMAPFSSRGGPGMNLGVAKPDVTAPGVQILAGHTPTPATQDGGLPGQLFQAIQGTSMSSPHVAGAAALLRQRNPSWTPGQIKSALMTTATGSVRKEDGTTPATPFDTGSGRIDLSRAGDPGLLFDESADQYVALQGALWQSNYPSLYVPSFHGRMSVTRTVQSTRGADRAWRLNVVGPTDLKVSVPMSLAVPAFGTASFSIDVDGSGIEIGGTRHAVIEMSRPNEATLRFPVTVVRRAAPVPLAHGCAPTSLMQNAVTTCSLQIGNSTPAAAGVALSLALPSNRLQLVPGSVTGATASGNGLFFTGTLAGSIPGPVSVAPGTTPAGFLPLGLFGAAPFSLGDESIANFNVPAFRFGDRVYTRIGVVSNGYLVVGGGTGGDVDFINQNLPNPAPPNNVLAPFWTDLNPAAGGEMRIATLTDGVNTWLVVEWNGVREYSTARTASFQVWIGLGGAEDISYAYDIITGNGDGGFLTVGAENAAGSRGANRYFNGTGTLPVAGTELRVTTGPSTPGEVRTIGYSAKPTAKGSWSACALMNSSAYFGTQTACVPGTTTGK